MDKEGWSLCSCQLFFIYSFSKHPLSIYSSTLYRHSSEGWNNKVSKYSQSLWNFLPHVAVIERISNITPEIGLIVKEICRNWSSCSLSNIFSGNEVTSLFVCDPFYYHDSILTFSFFKGIYRTFGFTFCECKFSIWKLFLKWTHVYLWQIHFDIWQN